MSAETNRISFQTLLESIYPTLSSPHVYFQPPENIKMEYPAIIYNRYNIKNYNANNKVDFQEIVYQVIVIDKNPDSVIVDGVSKLPTARFNRHYISNGLNHDVFMVTYKKYY